MNQGPIFFFPLRHHEPDTLYPLAAQHLRRKAKTMENDENNDDDDSNDETRQTL